VNWVLFRKTYTRIERSIEFSISRQGSTAVSMRLTESCETSCVISGRMKRLITQEKMPRRSTISSLQTSIYCLSVDEQKQLHEWLGKHLEEQAFAEVGVHRSEAEPRNYEGRTYVLQKRRCGKLHCSCMDGEILEVGHGPYWYAYWNDNGKTKNKYVGKRAPWQNNQLKKTSWNQTKDT